MTIRIPKYLCDRIKKRVAKQNGVFRVSQNSYIMALLKAALDREIVIMTGKEENEEVVPGESPAPRRRKIE